jgi:hypothetical protein
VAPAVVPPGALCGASAAAHFYVVLQLQAIMWSESGTNGSNFL